MKITFLVFNLDGAGGTARSVITQVNALSALPRGPEVSVISVTRSGEAPHFHLVPEVPVEYLVSTPANGPARPVEQGLLTDELADRLAERESILVPRRWDRLFNALYDVALERRLPQLDADVVVSTTPELLAVAAQLLRRGVSLVHEEHRSTSQRIADMEPLLLFAPRAHVVAALTTPNADWLREQLGESAPEIVVMPNPLPMIHQPLSRVDEPVIVSAGRLAPEKQFPHVVRAFGQIADKVPDWRLRIFGDGPRRHELVSLVRELDLYDRVELPGLTQDMASEWGRAGFAVLASKAEGFPLVVQEAMSAGVPVVSYDCPSGPREIITHEHDGLLVSNGSPSGLGAAMLRLATDPDLRRTLGANARASSTRYDAATIAGQWLEIFDRVAARPGADRVTGPLEVPAKAPAAPDRIDGRAVTPAEARASALSWTAQAASVAGAEWFVIPPHGTDDPVLVMAASHRDRFLEVLGSGDAPAHLSLRVPGDDGWHEQRGSLREMTQEVRRGMSASLVLEPWPEVGDRPSVIGQGASVLLQFWDRDVDGNLHSPRRNRYTDRVPPGSATATFELDGVTLPTLEVMTRPTVDDCRFPIDAVYTWVDGDDPTWNAAREARLEQLTGTALMREASGQARFRSRDELRYSLRSVHLFAPWVRTIHLVTAGQVPRWLDTRHPRIRLVDHSEILPASALPTFNSHAIESGLHRVPDLCEHFVYFNDDVMLGRPLRPQRFFSPSGHFGVFLSSTHVGLPGQDHLPYLQAAHNNRRALEEAFGIFTTNGMLHSPHPHRRSVLEEIEGRFPREVDTTSHSPFRSESDLALLSSFAQHYGLITGSAIAASADYAYVNLSNSEVHRHLNSLRRRDRDFFCLADHHDFAIRTRRIDQILRDFLDSYFPVPAPWELDAG